jgi:hypothetical protein
MQSLSMMMSLEFLLLFIAFGKISDRFMCVPNYCFFLVSLFDFGFGFRFLPLVGLFFG